MARIDYIDVDGLAAWEELTTAQLPEALAHDVITTVSRTIDWMCWRQADGFAPAGNTAEQRVYLLDPGARRLLIDDCVEVTEVRLGHPTTGDVVDLADLITAPFTAGQRGRAYEWVERLDCRALAPSRTRQRVYVTLRAGWPATPAGITQACKLGCARLLGRKDVRFGILESDEFGSVSLQAWDPDQRALICQYKRKSRVGGR